MTGDAPRNRDVSEIRRDIIARLDKRDMSVQELCSEIPDEDWVVVGVMEHLAAERKVCIARGTSGKRWTTTEKAKALELAEVGPYAERFDLGCRPRGAGRPERDRPCQARRPHRGREAVDVRVPSGHGEVPQGGGRMEPISCRWLRSTDATGFVGEEGMTILGTCDLLGGTAYDRRCGDCPHRREVCR